MADREPSVNERLADTLAALQRGEKPGCPWCGNDFATRVLDGDEVALYDWACGSYFDMQTCIDDEQHEYPGEVRSSHCYEWEIATLTADAQIRDEDLVALRAEVEAWRSQHMLDVSRLNELRAAQAQEIEKLRGKNAILEVANDERSKDIDACLEGHGKFRAELNRLFEILRSVRVSLYDMDCVGVEHIITLIDAGLRKNPGEDAAGK